MALIVITVCDSEGGPRVNLLGEPSLDKIDPKKETPAQQCALAMLNALQATLNGFEEKKSRIIIADVTDTPLH